MMGVVCATVRFVMEIEKILNNVTGEQITGTGHATGVIMVIKVPTRPGKPGKMRVHVENLEISWNFEKFNKYHGKMT